MARALAEDLGSGDLTAALVPDGSRAKATILCREDAVLCGRPYAAAAFLALAADCRLDWSADDGDPIRDGQAVCRLEGPARALLSAERTALNFLQTLSATATLARRYVEAVAGTGCTVLDTRKTVPGLRQAQKYAVRCGGASNHRAGLWDAILIKENHIAAAGSIAAAVAAARRSAPGKTVEVEVESLAELAEALDAGAEIVMLDDFPLEDLRRAVAQNRAHARPSQLEASGGVGLANVREIAATGVDYVSVGALTKNVKAVDLSMRFG